MQSKLRCDFDEITYHVMKSHLVKSYEEGEYNLLLNERKNISKTIEIRMKWHL